jgi:TRAP-type C4-dicarboxylate transport system permease small subunit
MMEHEKPIQRHPFLTVLTRMLEYALIVAMGLLVIDVLWGVFSRMLASWGILSSQSSWTEELARYLMIWVGLLGASLAFESRSHLGVDYFVGKFDPAGRKILKLAALFVVLVFAVGVLMIGGWQLVSRTLALKQDTPALGIPKGWVYLAVPISGVFTALFTLGHLLDVLRDRDETPQPLEEGMD